jgi:hypothetical protein
MDGLAIGALAVTGGAWIAAAASLALSLSRPRRRGVRLPAAGLLAGSTGAALSQYGHLAQWPHSAQFAADGTAVLLGLACLGCAIAAGITNRPEQRRGARRTSGSEST